ncbi:MAG: hypothetical protein Q9207_008489 [Kuettlingeria erythrocarpa]
MAEESCTQGRERLSIIASEDGTLLSMETTEADLSIWLDSDACTLEAVGWEISLNNQPVGHMPFQDFVLYNGPGCWPPSEVLQLETASAAGDLPMVKSILQHWHETPKDKQINLDLFASSFEFAMKEGHISIASYMLECGVSMNEAHFKRAMKQKSYSFLELFISYGFDINSPRSSTDPAPLADTFDDQTMTRWFLNHGADPNAETRMGVTPISRALVHASIDIIEMLLDHGGPQSIDHGQLLHHAVHRETSDRLQVLEHLFTKGALRVINQLKYQDRLDLFEEENLIVGCGTPLHEAARLGKQDVVELLVARGADPLIRDGKGLLAIDLAFQAGQGEVVEYLNSLSCRSLL